MNLNSSTYILRQGKVAIVIREGIWSACADSLATVFATQGEAAAEATRLSIPDALPCPRPVAYVTAMLPSPRFEIGPITRLTFLKPSKYV